jgi:glycosyltransferase involved in cell wall biosynthesis
MCTYNGSRTIVEALRSIAEQANSLKEVVEIIILDNASTDDTSKIVLDSISKFQLNARLLFEARPGKISAFLRGVKEAKGKLISVIDDDNFIEPQFIKTTLEIFEKYPTVGLVGSSNEVLVEETIPQWFEWVKSRYGCAKPYFWGDKRIQEDDTIIGQRALVAGAGSTFLAEPLKSCLSEGYIFFNDTQRGKKMSVTCEDFELCWLIYSLGYDFAYNPSIRLRHSIDPNRLNLKYLQTLCRAIGAGRLGTDPFLLFPKSKAQKSSIKYTWQFRLLWELLAILKAYILSIFAPPRDPYNCFEKWLYRIERVGAMQRIISERNNYTRHIRQVVFGKWNKLRVR